MIQVHTGLRSYAMLLFFVAGGTLILAVLVFGFAKVVELLLPLLIIGSYLLIIVFLLGFLPAALIKDLRPLLVRYSVLMSYALGAATWMMSYFIVIKAFGFLGIFFAFLFQYLAPIALLGAILKGTWHIAGHLTIWIGFTYAMRYYSQRLSNLEPLHQKKGDIIDVDAIEVSEGA